MRRVVTGGDLSQRAMRPPDLLNAYLARVEADVAAFGLLAGGIARSCPACGGAGRTAFERMGFSYLRCDRCESLFVSPLTDRAFLDRYHREGTAEAFWREEVLRATATVRARHAVGPRAHWVMGTATARLGTGLTLCELRGGDSQLRELVARSATFRHCESLPLERLEAGGDLGGSYDLVVGFETFERVYDLSRALARCHRLLRPGGLLFVSTLSGNGFEVRMLGGYMRSLVPPVHLQLLSREGWFAALGPVGFEVLEYSTPGELDVQAVADACRLHAELRLPPIVDELVRQDEEVTHAFQEVLQQAGLSAHVQFVAAASPPS